jgi:hypothetical protein
MTYILNLYCMKVLYIFFITYKYNWEMLFTTYLNFKLGALLYTYLQSKTFNTKVHHASQCCYRPGSRNTEGGTVADVLLALAPALGGLVLGRKDAAAAGAKPSELCRASSHLRTRSLAHRSSASDARCHLQQTMPHRISSVGERYANTLTTTS